MVRTLVLVFLIGVSPLLTPEPVSAVTIPTVHVGNPGNAPDPLTGNLYGSVAKNYRIGTTEVTNAQYAAFLNEKAKSDPLSLYSANMDSQTRGGITRTGVSGSFSYTTKPNMADKPVNYVSWYDAIRFANWLHNGQGSGDTETGAYTILGGTATPSNGLSITRNPTATWFLTSENEWYKAAYHQPAAQGGDSDDYWRYPTGNNNGVTNALASAEGDIVNPGANVANYANPYIGGAGTVTTVGSAGPLSQSFYGTADQAGNVWEWNETLISSQFSRGMRGGSFAHPMLDLASSNGEDQFPTYENSTVGFRVATVPEPSTAMLASIGCAIMWVLRKQLKSPGGAR